MGTRGGVSRFDGTRFQNWKDELPAARVTSLAVDREDRIWIGTTAGLCVRCPDAGQEETFVNAGQGGESKLSACHIRALMTDSDGYVWAATIDGILFKMEYIPGEGVRVLAETPFIHRYFEGDYPYQQIYEDAEGRLWLGGRILCCQYIEDRNHPEAKYRFTEHQGMGSYASVRGTLYGFNDFNSTLCLFDRPDLNEIGRLPVSHATLLGDSRGRLWAAGSYGLALVDTEHPEQTIVFRHETEETSSLASSELYCIFEDRQGNLWTGGDNGLSVLCPALQQVETLDLPSRQVTALLPSRDGRLWVGTADSGAYAIDRQAQPADRQAQPSPRHARPDRASVEHVDYRPAGRVNEGHVSCLYEDSAGAVYIGLWAGCGFNIWENGRVRRSAVSGPIPEQQHCVAWEDRITSNWIADFLEDRSGRFWVVTWEGVGLNEWDRKTGKTAPPEWLSPFFSPTPQTDSNIFVSSRLGSRLIEDAAGNLVYATTEAGLNIIDKTTRLVTKYLPDPEDPRSLPDNYVTDLCLAPDGTLWAATRGGLWSPSRGRLLHGTLVQSVRTDDKGRIWAGTEEGLYFIDTDGSIGIAKTVLGFPSDIYGEHTACNFPDGRLAFGGLSGAAVFHPDSLLAVGKPELTLTEFSLEGGRLRFAFSSTNLPLAAHQRYRYRLEGEDKDWIQAHFPDLQARYSGLRPGRYTLRIECTDIFGREAASLSVPVRVLAPLLLRWPFILLYLLLLAGGIWLAIRLRERKLRQDNARLEAAVTEKTARIQEELDTRNRFFSIISHDLRGPVSGIRRLSEELAKHHEALSPEELGEALEELRGAATGTSSLLENLLLWSLNQKGVLTPVMRDESLADILATAVGTVQEAAAAKKVRMEVSAADRRINTDRNMLTTCLRNILANAVRFSPEGGAVFIEAGESSLSIRDQGPGMDPSVLASLSKPGHLGLVITKDLLEKMGFRLTACNPPEGGCKITIDYA